MSRLLVGRGTGNRATRRVSPEKFYALLANLLTQFCNKDEIVKIQFLPCPVYPPLCSSSFFSSFCWTGKQSNNCFFAVHSPVGFYACRKLRCKRCYNNNNNENSNNYKVFRLFSFCSTWTATINWNYSLKIAPYFDAVQRRLTVQSREKSAE